MLFVYFTILIVCIAFLTREGLILSGLLKDPILRTFEKYGDTEHVYNPLPSILLWTGLMLISLAPLTVQVLPSMVTLIAPGMALVTLALWTYRSPRLALDYPHLLLRFPHWYADLRERTSRYERRRIAYLWLALPWRLRLLYNGSDHAFSLWADLVIMATMRYDEKASLGQAPSHYNVWDY